MARNPLPYRVECNSGFPPCFEVIAAFNVECVAHRYERECGKSNPYNNYRVTYRGKKIVES